ncbi:hypothetical protein [Desulfurispira natronophila]|uniref:Uncharacterized protein n=1 Tax=Desulfurispira natronophila TaxID=682562 RepID=A0A7W8DHU8_9BACT|nr:hypothetical protein [Desulfurispira natronophila]MBB5022845.1 hypothetical protein [Desulfurispira natronophila]
MNLYKEAITFSTWFAKINLKLLYMCPFITTSVIVAAVLSRITRLMAFFLPLKVIILAGSDRVPRYFQFFIEQEDKPQWIIIFTVGAIVSYIAYLLLDALSNHLSHIGGNKVASSANAMTVIANQETAARSYYERANQTVADTLFFTLGMLLIAFVNTTLFLYIITLLLAMFIISIYLTSNSIAALKRLKSFVIEKTSSYVTILSSIIFLTGFLVILWPYLHGEGPNLLLSLLSLIVMKRSLSAADSAVVEAKKFTLAKTNINALIFRGHKIARRERIVEKAVQELFHKEARSEMAAEQLKVSDSQNIQSLWTDSPLPGVSLLHIKHTENEITTNYLQQIFHPRHKQMPEREAFLFSHIKRKQLHAPELVAGFQVDKYPCQITHFGNATPISGHSWQGTLWNILISHWQLTPPKKLIKSYRLSYKLMHERLTPELVNKVRIAADNANENLAIDRFLADIPKISNIVQSIPLYIHNRDIQPGSVVMTADATQPLITVWGRWSLEPVGARLPRNYTNEELTFAAELLSKSRLDADKGTIKADHLLLVNNIRNMELEVSRLKYRSALELILSTQNSPLLQQEEYSKQERS